MTIDQREQGAELFSDINEVFLKRVLVHEALVAGDTAVSYVVGVGSLPVPLLMALILCETHGQRIVQLTHRLALEQSRVMKTGEVMCKNGPLQSLDLVIQQAGELKFVGHLSLYNPFLICNI